MTSSLLDDVVDARSLCAATVEFRPRLAHVFDDALSPSLGQAPLNDLEQIRLLVGRQVLDRIKDFIERGL